MGKHKNPDESGKSKTRPQKSGNKPSRNKQQTTQEKTKTGSPKSSLKDPYAKREAQKYEQPIASRELILELVEKHAKPVSFAELLDVLKISPDNEETLIALTRRLKAMLRDGQLVQNRRGAYGLPAKMDLVKGRVSANAGGFGFLIPEEGGDDLFLSPGQMKALLDGDIILAKVSGIDRRGRKEGRVVDILERNTHEVVGRYFYESGIAFLEADSKKITNDILIVDSDKFPAKSGQLVVAEIVKQPDYRSPALAKLTEILGEHMAPGMEIELAIRSHQLPHEWPEDLEQEVLAIPDSIAPESIKTRHDFRDINFLTIDDETARDFDDAIFCEQNKNGWQLSVAIADVANYVHGGSALDREALNRGNSVYFPQRVIPMLPEKLSNGLCSLNPHQDRLTMVCEMHLDKQGELLSYQFMEACIHSKARLTYNQVAEFLDEGEVSEALSPVSENITAFYNLFKKLKVIRDKRGAINIETTESRFIFNEEKKIQAVLPVVRNVAHQMIEEAMLLANTCTAKLLEGNNLPALYRVHDEPSEEKMNDLKEYLQPLGFRLKAKAATHSNTAYFNEAIAFAQGRPDQELINTIVLRSMQQAMYSEVCSQHFGLAYEHYAHFTSPIRRYADLIVHRAIKYFVRSGTSSKRVRKVAGAKALEKSDMLVSNQALLHERAVHISMTERRADLATRDAMDWLKCEFMLDKVGQTFSGKISSVTAFGLFVLLDDIFIEGLVHISDLKKDYYHYDQRRHELQAEHSKEVFRLSDAVRIQVSRVSLEDKKIEFVLEGEEHLGRFLNDNKGSRKPGPPRSSRNKSSRAQASGKQTSGKDAKKKKSRKQKQKTGPGQGTDSKKVQARQKRKKKSSNKAGNTN